LVQIEFSVPIHKENRTMPEKVIIFANPIAGRGRGKILASRLDRELTAAGYSVKVFFDRPSDIPPELLLQPTDTAISIGGDGTLRSVVNLLYANEAEHPAILPVPMGTANLMSRHLGAAWPQEHTVAAVLATLRRRKIARLDAGRANGRLFLLMAGVGIDAQIVHLLDHMRTGPIDMTSYLLPAAITFAAYTFPPITVRVNQKIILRNTPAIAMIGNVKEYGTGFPILTGAVPTDGLLDICVMPCRNRFELIELLVQIAAGEHQTREDVIYMHGKTADVESANPVAIQIDGDAAGFTPLAVDLLPGRIRFLVPV
jgi:diacylglycerol kinase (ATP)